MKQRIHRILSLLLVCCLVLGLCPAWAADTPETISVSSAAELAAAVEQLNESNGGIIILTNSLYRLSTPLTVTNSVTLQSGSQSEVTIEALKSGDWTTGSDVGLYNGLIWVVGEDGLLTIESGITVNANERCRAITVTDGAGLSLEGCTITGGSVANSQQGAGIMVGPNCALTAMRGTVIKNNNGATSSATSGGGIYVGAGAVANLDDVTFSGNRAHSGGAIYTYHGYVFCTGRTEFSGNSASQRGGAIHDHGTVALYGTTITNHSSEQYGGAVYVSANQSGSGTDIGRLILRNATITGNSCGNSGGGVYVADLAQVLVDGSTKITDNTSTSGGESYTDNTFAATSSSKIIAYGALSGKIGVSTSNAYKHKVLVYSLKPEYIDFGTAAPSEEYWTNYELPENYTYTMTASDMSKFVYDADVFTLEKATGTNDMWLNYSTAVGESSPKVVFDFNLPGKAAITYPSADTSPAISVGDTITLPSVSNVTSGNITYTFQGWYSDATGGTRYTGSVTVEEGLRVYYAQWTVKTSSNSSGSGVPGNAGLSLVYYDQNYEGGGLTTAYTFGGQFTFTVSYTVTINGETKTKYTNVNVYVPFELPSDPVRTGYTFQGWSEDPSSVGGFFQGSGWAPSKSVTTLYATWRANSHTLKWDANGGTSGGTTGQDYGSVIVPPTTVPTRTGYTFTGWYKDSNCSVALVDGSIVRGNATYYAGWKAITYTVIWDANYTGGAVTTIQQDYDEQLDILPAPVRSGYAFTGWYSDATGGTRAERYGKITGNSTWYAHWSTESQDYNVTVEWADQSDNDRFRPASLTVALLANDIPTGLTYTLTAADADSSGNKWSYQFEDLAVTDEVSNPITYSVAITSSVSAEYSYGIENKSATLGYILMTHKLVTRNVTAYVAWDDDSDRDGQRPETVRLQLCADGTPLEDGEAVTTLTGSGNAWSYAFENVQKYLDGEEIVYTVQGSDVDHYEVTSSDYTVTYRHAPAQISQTVAVVWADSDNQDGKRPASMMVQLFANNMPVAEKYVLLSDANEWTYTWDNLYRYANGTAIDYSAHVTSTLIDYTAATTGMTIEMTYVPSSTTVSATLSWEDLDDVDGLRPETVLLELRANGVSTGDTQIFSATTGWMGTWKGYPIYKDGQRIEYTVAVVEVPDGYTAEYYGIYDTSGLSVVLSHSRAVTGQTVQLIWNDQNDVALARPSKVKVMLYADNIPLLEKTAVLTAEEWSHEFAALPIYRDGGVKIQYSAYVISDIGRYTTETDGTEITLNYDVETVTVPLNIKWDDNDNADGQRPEYVVCTLTIDGIDTPFQSMATAESNWAVAFDKLKIYTTENPGIRVNYGVRVTLPEGYTAVYAGTYCALRYVPQTTQLIPAIHWNDNNNQYAQRPDKLLVSLLADGVSTGKAGQLYAADNWIGLTFSSLPRYSQGAEITYSVSVSGAGLLDYYDVEVVGGNVYCTHKSIQAPSYTADVTGTIKWKDNSNAHGSRPEEVTMLLLANGEIVQRHTLATAEMTGNLWEYTFADMPTMDNGTPIAYTISANVDNYRTETDNTTVALVQIGTKAVEAVWNDRSNADDKRPESLTVELVADGVSSKKLTLTGESWKSTFENLDVWNGKNEIAYSFQLTDESDKLVKDAGYTVSIQTSRIVLTRSVSSSGGSSGNSGGAGGGGSSGGGGGSGSTQSKNTVVNAYVTGYVDGTFCPGAGIARCEVAAIFARISEDYDESKTYAVPFEDVAADAWYRNYLGYCVFKGIITGYADNTFRGLAHICRSEFAAIAARYLGLDSTDVSDFVDVAADNWATGYIAQLAERGIVQGVGNHKFAPEDNIDRASAVRIVNGILDRRPDEVTLEEKMKEGWFTDVPQTHWAYYEIAEAAYTHTHMKGAKNA